MLSSVVFSVRNILKSKAFCCLLTGRCLRINVVVKQAFEYRAVVSDNNTGFTVERESRLRRSSIPRRLGLVFLLRGSLEISFERFWYIAWRRDQINSRLTASYHNSGVEVCSVDPDFVP